MRMIPSWSQHRVVVTMTRLHLCLVERGGGADGRWWVAQKLVEKWNSCQDAHESNVVPSVLL
jgi:hypothetical protein